MDRCDNCMKSFRDLDVPRADATAGLARSVMEDNLGHLDQEESVLAEPPDSALAVARRMKEAGTGCALVLEGDKLVGIFTEHDVLCKLAGAKAGEPPVAVGELMRVNPEALEETDSVAAALNKMAVGRYRHVPVRRADGSYAVASIKGVLKYIAQADW
jgi:CBS domain-containing protein